MIACHAGAGYHSPSLEAAYRRDLAAACRAGAAALERGGSALAAVTAAIQVLEDSELGNAGRGSNLSFGGLVECDASVMAGDGAFGAVAAAPGIRNPVAAAALMAEEGRLPLSNGRVRPMMLAGDRAREWALSRGLPAAATAEEAASWHITAPAQRQWRKWRGVVDASASSSGSGQAAAEQAAERQPKAAAGGKRASEQPEAEAAPGSKQARRSGSSCGRRQPEQQQQQQQQQHSSAAAAAAAAADAADADARGCFYDTVGCVVLAPDGSVAAGVSSGGILLKTEGRVGEAAAFGAGCWAQGGHEPVAAAAAPQQQLQQQQQVATPALACSVTGVGERVMRHLLARDVCQQAAAAAAAAADAQAAGGEASGSPGPAEQPLAEQAAALLRRTILRGPLPHDAGLLCLKATPLTASEPGTAAAEPAAGSSGRQPEPQQPEQRQQEQQQQRGWEVELGVAHCAVSMAVGHLACGVPASSGSRQPEASQAAPPPTSPAVFILRRQEGRSGQPTPAVQTYMHGAALHL